MENLAQEIRAELYGNLISKVSTADTFDFYNYGLRVVSSINHGEFRIEVAYNERDRVYFLIKNNMGEIIEETHTYFMPTMGTWSENQNSVRDDAESFRELILSHLGAQSFKKGA